MLVEPRPMAIAMAFLACLYLGFFLKSQSKEDGQVSDLRESLHHYVSGVLPWVSDKYDTSEPPPQIDLVNEEESPAQMTTTPITGAAAKTSPSQPTSPAVSHADDLESSSHIELPHLQELCRKTEWTPNLWLHCHSGCGASKNDFCGGLNNARNRFQTCVRWAIDAGAGIILPTVVMRGDDPQQLNVGEEKCLDAWWDLEHLDKTMAANCPQLKLRAACAARADDEVAIPPPEAPSIPPLKPPMRPYTGPRMAKGDFRDKVIMPALESADTTNATDASSNMTVVEYGDSFLGWDYRASGELNTIRRELHLAIRYQKHLLALGEAVRRSELLHGGAYIGVHLRGESDWPAAWGDAEQQKALYAGEMARIRALGSDVSAVFVSSGDQGAIQRFREVLAPRGYVVHDKWSIMEALGETGGLSEIEALDFDSKGIVDYAVLAGARFFMGVFMSTMSQYIAYTRTADIPDFFDNVIFANSSRDPGNNRIFSDAFTMHGDDFTSILVTNGLDIMDSFP